MNCRGCRQRFLPLPDLSRKIEGDFARRVCKELIGARNVCVFLPKQRVADLEVVSCVLTRTVHEVRLFAMFICGGFMHSNEVKDSSYG